MTKQTEIPYVSVIMPIRNEADFIQRSLGSVLTQDYPSERYEILIVDGMSTDNTRAIIAAVAADNPDTKIRILDNPSRIAPTAMNIAHADAQGDIIVRVDGHCEIAPDYISQCVLHLSTEEVEGVGGPIETIGNGLLSNCIAIAMSSNFGVGGSAFRTIKDRKMLVDTIPFPAYRREAIKMAGPYDEELVRNQDDEYNYRLRSLGGRLLLSPSIHSKYYSRSSLRSLARQYFQYGYWKVRVLQKHPRQMRWRQFVPPAFIACLCLGTALAPFSEAASLATLSLLGLYFLADLCAAVMVALQRDWTALLLLPILYPIIHFSFGAGFLLGLIKFSDRWGEKKNCTLSSA